MPGRKRRRGSLKPRRLRRRRRRRKGGRRFARRSLILGGFPTSKMVRFRYVQQITLNASAAAAAVHVFRANSLYDPDSTGTGHQPANFDRWTNIYDHYTVVGSRIRVKFTPSTTNNNTPAIIGIVLSDSGSEISGNNWSTEDLLEKRLTKASWRSVGYVGNPSVPRVAKNFSARKFFGKPNGTMIGDGQYRGRMGNFGTGGNPAEGAFFEVFSTNIAGNDPANLPLLVTIDYLAVLTEPKPEDES